jgi:pyruvate/2-oxoglutarate dehydrogenase complex dihydrolipoamide acyltransferase (E2) component
MEYKNVGNHAYDLASGLVLAPGESSELSDDAVKDPHNVSLIDDGVLIPTGERAGVNATDDAIELASKEGVDLSLISGSGASGRITKRDIERELELLKEGDRK